MRRVVWQPFLLIALTVPWASWTGSIQSEEPPIFDIGALAKTAPESLLGIEVVAADVQVREVVTHGFWVTLMDSEERVFIVPAEGNLITVRAGELISVHGEVRIMRRPVDPTVIARRAFGLFSPYVYAYTVRPAWPQERQVAIVRD